MEAVKTREVASLAVEPTALLAAEIKKPKMQLKNLVAVSSHPRAAAKYQADVQPRALVDLAEIKTA
jgi:hypothetical protein